MKYFILSFMLLLFGITARAQTTDHPQAADCQKFRNGTFKIVDEKIGNFTIVRNGDKQVETKDGDTESFNFNVKWIDDCTYTLTADEAFHKKFPDMPANALLTVTIIKTTATSYTQKSTSNFSDLVAICEMVKVK